MFFRKQIFGFCLILFLVGCAKKANQTKNSCFSNKSYLEAKLVDIPTPLITEPILSGITANSYAFSSKDSIENIIYFYETEMEFLGWRRVAKFASFEALLIFEKPNKQSVISIRPDKKLNKVFIFF